MAKHGVHVLVCHLQTCSFCNKSKNIKQLMYEHYFGAAIPISEFQIYIFPMLCMYVPYIQ